MTARDFLVEASRDLRVARWEEREDSAVRARSRTSEVSLSERAGDVGLKATQGRARMAAERGGTEREVALSGSYRPADPGWVPS